jgi:hypothetical protein
MHYDDDYDPEFLLLSILLPSIHSPNPGRKRDDDLMQHWPLIRLLLP